MSLFSVFLIGIGLSMDACAVSFVTSFNPAAQSLPPEYPIREVVLVAK